MGRKNVSIKDGTKRNGEKLGRNWARREEPGTLYRFAANAIDQGLADAIAQGPDFNVMGEPPGGWARHVVRLSMSELEWAASSTERRDEVAEEMFGEHVKKVTGTIAAGFIGAVLATYESADAEERELWRQEDECGQGILELILERGGAEHRPSAAIHEAGHAVMAQHCGLLTAPVSIDNYGGGFAGGTGERYLGWDDPVLHTLGGRVAEHVSTKSDARLASFDEVKSALEETAHTKAEPIEEDLVAVVRLLRRCATPSMLAPERLLNEIQFRERQVKRVLRHQWPAVEAIAAGLMSSSIGRLGAAEVDALLSRHWRPGEPENTEL